MKFEQKIILTKKCHCSKNSKSILFYFNSSDPVVITRPCQKPIPVQINNDPNLSNIELPTIKKTNQKALSPIGNLANLAIFAIAELLGGFTFSLLSPFYTQEATNKGLTVTQTGLVRTMNFTLLFAYSLPFKNNVCFIFL